MRPEGKYIRSFLMWNTPRGNKYKFEIALGADARALAAYNRDLEIRAYRKFARPCEMPYVDK